MHVNFPPLEKIINQTFIPLFENQDRYLLLWGGRGSSKSNFTAKKLIYDCLNEPYLRFILIRNTYATIKDSQYQTIKDIVEEWGLQSLFTFKENPLEIKCWNGNMIYARGCDDVAKIKSIKDPSGAWYEEANEIKEEDFLTITTSIRTAKARFLQEILSFNPECEGEPEDFWINKWFFNGKPVEKCFTSTLEIRVGDKTLSTSYTAHHSTYHDNQWITPEFIAFIEYLRDTNPYYYQVFCLGEWGTKPAINPFAYNFDEKFHLTRQVGIDQTKRLHISIDFNLNPFGCLFSNIYRDESGLYVNFIGELSIENGSIHKMAERIKASYGPLLQNCLMTGDAMGKRRDLGQADNASNYETLRRSLELRQNQLIIPPNPTHETSRNDFNYLLHIAKDWRNRIKVQIHPDLCPGFVNDLRNVNCNAEGEIIKGNRNDLSQRADMLDCGRYTVHSFLRDEILRHQKLNFGNLILNK